MHNQREQRLDYVSLSKTIAYALRHRPWLYELELDEEGWVPVEDLLEILRAKRTAWRDLRKEDLVEMNERFEKRRYELRDGRIRALYGHTVPGKLAKEEAAPPEILYHGTQPAALASIRTAGLQPMKRQYVHLSLDTAMAQQVARRRTNQPVILRIKAGQAYKRGVKFYRGNEFVWLADHIPSEFIEMPQ